MGIRAHGVAARAGYRVRARVFIEWRKRCLRSNHLRRLWQNTLAGGHTRTGAGQEGGPDG